MDTEQNIYNPTSEGTSIKDLLVNNDEEEVIEEPEPVPKQQVKHIRRQKIKKNMQIKKSVTKKYYHLVIEVLILLTLYVLMSQELFISQSSKYIKYLQPQQDGTTSFTGIIIYGIVLCILFIVVRGGVFEYITPLKGSTMMAHSR